MLYGCCVNLLPKTLDRIGLEYAGRLKRLGYDYIELPLNELAQLSEQEFRDARTVLEELDLPCRACNDFMPARFQITGPDVTSRAELTDYLRRALERAARLGISFAVFGSPWSRSCPEHYSREAAFGQIAEFLSLAGEEAAPYQVVIAIEPMLTAGTHEVRTIDDGWGVVTCDGRPAAHFERTVAITDDGPLVLTPWNLVKNSLETKDLLQ